MNLVELDDVWAHYDGLPVLEAIDLIVEDHDFLGIIGPNGGGKTTLLKVILGLIRPDRGSVKVLGKDPAVNRMYIGYTPQHKEFDREFPISVMDVVLIGRLGRTGLFRRYGEEDYRAAKDALDKVGMYDFKDRQIGKLSGGQRQRVYIARAIVSEPKVLLLDEPMAGVDSTMQGELYDLFKELNDKCAIVMVSHDISAVSVHVDKVACLNHRLYYHGSKELLSEDIEAAYGCPVDFIAHGVPHRVLKKH
jgi:zinc transport system ATP-binding protein